MGVERSERQHLRTVAAPSQPRCWGSRSSNRISLSGKSPGQLGLAYNTACRLHHILRTVILCTAEDATTLKGEIELDESYFGGVRKGKRGRGAAGKVPVFSLLDRGGKERVEVVQNVKGEALLELTLKKVTRGSLLYPVRFQSYNGLVQWISSQTDRLQQTIRQREGVHQRDRRFLVVRKRAPDEVS